MEIIIKNSHLLAELYCLLKVLFALIAGGVIGLERVSAGKEAGIRTFGFICAGACSYTALATLVFPDSSARVVANVVVGIGFIAGGVIYRSDADKPSHGLTTASSLWVTATIGVIIGFELYILALGVILLTLLTLHLPSSRIWLYLSKKHSDT